MPEVQQEDQGAGEEGHQAPPPVRERTSILDARIRRRANWPFFYYQENGRFYVNKAPRQKKIDVVSDVGEARW